MSVIESAEAALRLLRIYRPLGQPKGNYRCQNCTDERCLCEIERVNFDQSLLDLHTLVGAYKEAKGQDSEPGADE